MDGDKGNKDYVPSIKGRLTSYTTKIMLDRPSGTHTIQVVPVVEDGEEDYDYAQTIKNVKLNMKKPVKPSQIKVKLLRDGTLEWTWKDVPADYEGEAAYVIFRKGIRDKLSSENRTRSSNGRFIEKLNIADEKIVNNRIVRYISRLVNVEGASGDDFESDKVMYKIKLPDPPPTPTLKRYEYTKSNSKFTIEWSMKDSRNLAKKYKYLLLRNGEIVAESKTVDIKQNQIH